MSIIKDIEKGRKFDKAESLDAQILKAVNALEFRVQNGFLGVQEITAHLNNGKSLQQQLTFQRVGRRLKALGFDRGKLGDSAAICWDASKIEQLKVSYGLKDTPETPDIPETPPRSPRSTSEPPIEGLPI